METKVVLSPGLNEPMGAALRRRYDERFLLAEDWIERHGSGTLRKNRRLGFAWAKHYMKERIAYEFGHEFEMMPRTRVVYNDANSEPDSKPITEAGWFIERYITLSIFPEDRFEAKYIIVEEPDGSRREGIGIVVLETSFNVPAGNMVFAIISEYSHTLKDFLPAKNPF